MKIINLDIENNIEIKDYFDTDTGATKNINSAIRIPTGNYNSILLNFNFISPDASQEGLHLLAIFETEYLEKKIEVELSNVVVNDVTYEKACYIPIEVMQKIGKVNLGIYGYSLEEDGTLKERISLNPITFSIITGSYDENTTEGITPEPTVFEVYFDKISNAYNRFGNELKAAKTEFKDEIATTKVDLENEIDENVSTLNESVNSKTTNLQAQINSLASGSPLSASSISEMTDTAKVYVNTTDGNWYYYNGIEWVSGGVYQAVEIADDSVTIDKLEDRIKEDLYNPTVNIFNKNAITEGVALITWSETLSVNGNNTYAREGWYISNVMEVSAGDVINFYAMQLTENVFKSTQVQDCLIFDVDGNYLANGGANISSVTIPENGKYILIDANDIVQAETLMVTVGEYDATGGYQPFGYISKVVTDEELKNELKNHAKKTDLENYVKKSENDTYIMFSFDAFRPDADDTRYVMMNERNFPCVICLSQTILTWPLTKEAYYRFMKNNVELSVYAGKGDRPSSYYDSSEEAAWNAWVTDLVTELGETSGMFEPLMYSASNNQTGPNLTKAVKDNGFLLLRANASYNEDGTNNVLDATNLDSYMIDGLNSYIIPTKGINKTTTLEEITTLIDYAVTNHKSLMLMTHYVLPEAEAGDYDAIDTVFEQILDYVKTKQDNGDLKVVNPRQFYNIYSPFGKGYEKDYRRLALRTNYDTTSN